jgi:Fur family ferric uptake transcriptional regulator
VHGHGHAHAHARSPDPAHTREIAIFEEYLRKRGLKLTLQRSTLARKVFDTARHFSAEELLEELSREKKRISKATLYRTLALLEEANLITSIDFGRGFKFYEHAHAIGHEHHEHLVCIECFKIVEFMNPELETFHERIARSHGFRVLSHTYKIYGICSACAAKKAAPSPPRTGSLPITR